MPSSSAWRCCWNSPYMIVCFQIVIPAKAGISLPLTAPVEEKRDSSFRWNDGLRRDRPSLPVEHDLAGAALQHRLEAGLEVGIGHAVGDDRGESETGLDHRRHLVPGLEHLAA